MRHLQEWEWLHTKVLSKVCRLFYQHAGAILRPPQLSLKQVLRGHYRILFPPQVEWLPKRFPDLLIYFLSRPVRMPHLFDLHKHLHPDLPRLELLGAHLEIALKAEVLLVVINATMAGA